MTLLFASGSILAHDPGVRAQDPEVRERINFGA